MKYLVLYLNFLRFSFSKALEFRFDFFFRIFMDIVYYVISFIFFKIIFMHTATLGGMTEDQGYIFVASFIMVDAFYMSVFATNMWWLPFHINRGDLDYYLIRPISPLFFLSLREFSASSFVNLLMTIGLLIWAFLRTELSYSSTTILFYLGLLLNGSIIMFLMRLMFTIPVFWTHSERGFANILDGLEVFAERPHEIYQGFFKRLSMSIIPFALMASVPCTYLFNNGAIVWPIFLGLGVSLSMLYACLVFWKFGLKNYASASS